VLLQLTSASHLPASHLPGLACSRHLSGASLRLVWGSSTDCAAGRGRCTAGVKAAEPGVIEREHNWAKRTTYWCPSGMSIRRQQMTEGEFDICCSVWRTFATVFDYQ
jgi:hypothetical protein